MNTVLRRKGDPAELLAAKSLFMDVRPSASPKFILGAAAGGVEGPG
jgi:hypothetical protein